jgi:hypothetical protein
VTREFEYLAARLAGFRDSVRKGDEGTDPVFNDPAPYAEVRLVENGVDEPLVEFTLTAWHADSLAAGLAGSFGGTATQHPDALAQWTRSNWWVPENQAGGYIEYSTPGRTESHRVPLSTESAYGLGRTMDDLGAWVIGEQFLMREAPYHHKDKVRVRDNAIGAAAGRTGTVARVRLGSVGQRGDEPTFDFSVRMDDDPSGFCRTFRADELEPNRVEA